jgi:putative FmdB family regulatory protein
VPIYEYRCPKGHVFELFQRMDDAPPETCPTCGAGPVERVLYPVAVHFKGSGFYSTDYGRSRKTAKETDAGGDSKSGDSKPGDSKSEPKKPETSKSSD